MGLTDTVLEELTESVTQDGPGAAVPEIWFSLHSADPGGSGANEVTTGSGDAGRQQITFAGSAGTDTNASPVVFAVSGVSISWVGYWDAQTSGNWLGGFPLVGAGTMMSAIGGSSDLLCPAHGLSVNDVVRLFPMPGPALSVVPAGFTEDTLYFVKTVGDSDHLVLSSTMGGSAITPSGSGTCGMYVDESLNTVTGTLTFPATSGITYVTAS